MRLHFPTLFPAFALATSLLALPAPAFAQTGPEQTARFVKSVESTVKAIEETRQQIEKTVTGYNSIMDQTAKDTGTPTRPWART